jgi:ATP-dependent exoDNAse (exonuclease V) beta subunit
VVPLDERSGKGLEQEKEKLKAEQEDRKKKLELLRGVKQFKSVTSVLKVDADKQEREERVFEEPEVSSPWGGKELGTFAHLLLEKGWDWNEEMLAKGADHYRQRMGVTSEQSELALGWVKKALRHDLIQRAKKSGKVFRELPLTSRQEDGSYLNAVLDLAFLEDDQWVLVDYKTDQDPEKLKAKYQEQLGHYEKMLLKTTGKVTKEKVLCFLRKDPIRIESV